MKFFHSPPHWKIWPSILLSFKTSKNWYETWDIYNSSIQKGLEHNRCHRLRTRSYMPTKPRVLLTITVQRFRHKPCKGFNQDKRHLTPESYNWFRRPFKTLWSYLWLLGFFFIVCKRPPVPHALRNQVPLCDVTDSIGINCVLSGISVFWIDCSVTILQLWKRITPTPYFLPCLKD